LQAIRRQRVVFAPFVAAARYERCRHLSLDIARGQGIASRSRADRIIALCWSLEKQSDAGMIAAAAAV